MLVLTLALALAACGPTPTASPTDMTGVLNEFASHGAVVRDIIAGDAGCAESDLHSNGSHLTLTLTAEARDYGVYLFRWRRPSDYAAGDSAFQQCVAQFAREPSVTEEVQTIEVTPWRAFGTGWSDAMTDVIRQSLVAAAAGGG